MTEQNNEKEIAYQTGKVVGYCCKHPIRAMVKATYPVTGNLSQLVKSRLESTLGEETFSSANATAVSYFTNMFMYGALAETAALECTRAADENSVLAKLVCTGIAAWTVINFGGMATLVRESGSLIDGPKTTLEDIREGLNNTQGSVLGKIASLPIEFGMGLYDSIKKQSQAKVSP